MAVLCICFLIEILGGKDPYFLFIVATHIRVLFPLHQRVVLSVLSASTTLSTSDSFFLVFDFPEKTLEENFRTSQRRLASTLISSFPWVKPNRWFFLFPPVFKSDLKTVSVTYELSRPHRIGRKAGLVLNVAFLRSPFFIRADRLASFGTAPPFICCDRRLAERTLFS